MDLWAFDPSEGLGSRHAFTAAFAEGRHDTPWYQWSSSIFPAHKKTPILEGTGVLVLGAWR